MLLGLPFATAFDPRPVASSTRGHVPAVAGGLGRGAVTGRIDECRELGVRRFSAIECEGAAEGHFTKSLVRKDGPVTGGGVAPTVETELDGEIDFGFATAQKRRHRLCLRVGGSCVRLVFDRCASVDFGRDGRDWIGDPRRGLRLGLEGILDSRPAEQRNDDEGGGRYKGEPGGTSGRLGVGSRREGLDEIVTRLETLGVVA